MSSENEVEPGGLKVSGIVFVCFGGGSTYGPDGGQGGLKATFDALAGPFLAIVVAIFSFQFVAAISAVFDLALAAPKKLHMFGCDEAYVEPLSQAKPSQVYPRDTDAAAACPHFVAPSPALDSLRWLSLIETLVWVCPIYPTTHCPSAKYLYLMEWPSCGHSAHLTGATGTHLECAPLIRSIISMDL